MFKYFIGPTIAKYENISPIRLVKLNRVETGPTSEIVRGKYLGTISVFIAVEDDIKPSNENIRGEWLFKASKPH